MKTNIKNVLMSAFITLAVASDSQAATIVSDPLSGPAGTVITGHKTEVGGVTWHPEWPWDAADAYFAPGGTGITRGTAEAAGNAAASLWLPSVYEKNAILTVSADMNPGTLSPGKPFTYGGIGFSNSTVEGSGPKGPITNASTQVLSVLLRSDNTWELWAGGVAVTKGKAEPFSGQVQLSLTYNQLENTATVSIGGTKVLSNFAVSSSLAPVAAAGFQLWDGVAGTGLVTNFRVDAVPKP